jgi:hypothetical protein
VLGDVEETIYVVEEDEDEEEVVKVLRNEYLQRIQSLTLFSRLFTENQRCYLFEVCHF